MALTLAQRTQLRKRAAHAAATLAGPEQTMEGANIYELHLAQLHQDELRLKNIQATTGKCELKGQLLPNYLPYVDGVLEAGRGAEDRIVTTMMVWAIDAADYPQALRIAAYVLKHNLKLVDKFERTAGTLVAEEIAEAALKALKASGSFDLQTLLDTEQLTREQDMPDQARAKLHLAIGKAYQAFPNEQAAERLADLDKAKHWLKSAIDLHSVCGGKKDLERVVKLQKKHAAPPAS